MAQPVLGLGGKFLRKSLTFKKSFCLGRLDLCLTSVKYSMSFGAQVCKRIDRVCDIKNKNNNMSLCLVLDIQEYFIRRSASGETTRSVSEGKIGSDQFYTAFYTTTSY